MNSEWWDTFFHDVFASSKNALATVLKIAIAVRIFVCLAVSFEAGLGSPQIEMVIGKFIMYCILKSCENKSVMTKKIAAYAVIEMMNLFYKYLAVCVYQGESTLYCMCSTIFTVLFQTSIFQSDYHALIIIFKHISLWYFYDNKHENQRFNRVMAVLLIVSMTSICMLFEKAKRLKLRESYFLSKKEEKSNLQISELLRLFQDRLIIIDKNYKIQYKNEKASKFIKIDSDNCLNDLKIIKFLDGRCVFEVIQNLESIKNQNHISLGITEINQLLYE